MKKRQLTIREYQNPLGTYSIIINNARFHGNFLNNIKKIIEYFYIDEELFFGFYRTDGVNITIREQKKVKKEIVEYFQKNGDIQNLSEYLSVARIHATNYGFVALVFDYFLETMLFSPKVSWENFKQYHSAYQEHRFEDAVLNHFTDVLICYFDSGDLLICLNTEEYNPREVKKMIDETFISKRQGTKTGDGLREPF